MADALNFGPEWLRALSSGGPGAKSSITSPPPSPISLPSYKLADHRYGREEMLALYPQKNMPIPECLLEFKSMLSEKSLPPLAFYPPDEEEQRMLAHSVNSQAVMRMMGRGSSGPPLGRGRGGGDRGRGRGRGRGDGFFGSRAYDDESGGFGRGRINREASWDERERRFEHGFGRGYEEGAVPNPGGARREFSRSMSSDNWRTKREEEEMESGGGGDDEGGDWRKAKWSRSSWREPRERGYSDYSNRYNDTWERPSYNRSRSSESWNDTEDPDALPEWSKDDDFENDEVGTFDASGAFMSLKELRECDELEKSSDVPEKKSPRKDSPVSDKSDREKNKVKSREKSSEPEEKPAKTEIKGKTEATPPKETSPPKLDVPDAQRESSPAKTDSQREVSPAKSSLPSQPNHKTHIVPGQKINIDELLQKPSQAMHPGLANSREGSISPHAISMHQLAGAATSAQVEAESLAAMVSQEQAAANKPQTGGAATASRQEPASNDEMLDTMEDLVAMVTTEEENERAMSKSSAASPVTSAANRTEQNQASGASQEDQDKWFYRDPQGELQGPFASQEMAEWFGAGYFQMTLLVRRATEETFQPLGELIKRFGRVPFLSGPPSSAKTVPMATAGAAGVPGLVPMNPLEIASNLAANQQAAAAGQLTEAQLKMLQQQQVQNMLLQQQQQQQQQIQYLRRMHILQMLQAQEEYHKLSVQQQQALLYQTLLQHQGAAGVVPGLKPGLVPGSSAAMAAANQVSTSVAGATQPSLSPRPNDGEPRLIRAVQHLPQDDQRPTQHMPTSAPSDWTAGKQGIQSVWDLQESQPPQTQSLEEIQRLQQLEQERMIMERRSTIERKKQEEIERELQRQREQDERRRDEEEKERKREDERRKREEEDVRQREIERELERQRQEQRQRDEEAQRRAEEERQKRDEEEKRKRSEEEKRRREEQERQRAQEEEERRQAYEMDRRRQEEISRRQKAEEIRRQQEILRQLQAEQLAQMQLPATATWGQSTTNSNQSSSSCSSLDQGRMGGAGLTLSEIQRLEAEEMMQQQEEQKQLELQRAQLEAIHQQQLSASWAAKKSHQTPAQPVSLVQIQQEQAKQLSKKQQQSQQIKAANLPLSTAAAWGSSSNWASNGAWGRSGTSPQPNYISSSSHSSHHSHHQPSSKSNQQGFWEETSQKPAANQSNAHFPSLGNATKPNDSSPKIAAKSNKAKQREEENVQRLFQATKPQDTFTSWCEAALRDMNTSVDVPVFVAFLKEVESPFEVNDYIKSYLGETKEAKDFATQFLERRSEQHHQQRAFQQQDIWGSTPTISHNQGSNSQSGTNNNHNNDFEVAKSKKKKKKMHKLDNTILGFNVLASQDRVNQGEIETLP